MQVILPLFAVHLAGCVSSTARAAAPSPSETALRCADLPIVMAAFRRNHYLAPTFDEELSRRVATQFVRLFDPSRTLLLESDVGRLKDAIVGTVATAMTGKCSGLDSMADLLVSRAQSDVAFAKKTLTDKYVLDESTELILDPDKRGFAKSEAERTKLVEKMIHFQMSSLLGALAPARAREQLVHRYELVQKRLMERRVEGRVVELFAEAIASALDPHSSFMSADDLADFRIQMQLSLEGIGAALRSEDGFTVIESLVPGGQAEKSNQLQPKDKIIAVTQEGAEPVSVIDMDLRDVVKMIRGKKGTKVRLTVLREAENAQTFEVTIVRDKIDVKQQAAKIRYETRTVKGRSIKIGVLDLPSFYGGGNGDGRSSLQDVRDLLEEAKKEKAQGIVLDLSENGGGLLEDAVQISGLFLKRGAIVATKDTAGAIEELEDQDATTVWSGPLVVMVSPVSASASEILAGALQAYRRAIVVGSTNTFGKGTVQAIVPLPRNLGAIKVTTGMFFLPSGMSTQQRGVAADIVVPTPIDALDVGERSLDYSLQPQSIRAFMSKDVNAEARSAGWWKAVEATVVAALAQKSKQRIEGSDGFKELKQALLESKRDTEVVRLSELRKKEASVKETANAGATSADSAKPNETVATKSPKKEPKRTAKKELERSRTTSTVAPVAASDRAASQDKRERLSAVFVGEAVDILADCVGAL